MVFNNISDDFLNCIIKLITSWIYLVHQVFQYGGEVDATRRFCATPICSAHMEADGLDYRSMIQGLEVLIVQNIKQI